MTNVSTAELEPKEEVEGGAEIPHNNGDLNRDLVTGKIEITFRGESLEAVSADVDTIKTILGNVLKSEDEHNEKEAEKKRQEIADTAGFTNSDAVASKEIREAEKPKEQLIGDDDTQVRNLFFRLVGETDVWPNTSQKKIYKLNTGSKFVYSKFVSSFKKDNQNNFADNIADHWPTEQECFVVSSATADEIIKIFDGINNKARYGYQLAGEKEDVMILNLNGIKTAFIINGGYRHEKEEEKV